ncbi:MAG TPA: ATP-binding protein [Sporichthya sp.]|nr:ATP-binding protein [Sporichthya sp.]
MTAPPPTLVAPLVPPPPPPSAERRGRLHGAWSAWGPRAWSLRARLLAVVLALLSVVSLVIGVVSVLALRSYLIDQLDEKVQASASRTSRFIQSPLNDRSALSGPGQGEGTVMAQIRNGQFVGGPPLVLKTSGDQGPVAGNPAVLLTVKPDRDVPDPGGGLVRVSAVVTRDLGGDLGAYRLQAVALPDGSIAVTGLPMNDISETVFRLAGIITAVTLAGLALAAGAGAAIVRLALRPLRRVAATASQVATMPLDRGEVALAVRVPDSDTDPRTEVGQVGAAINNMLGHVGAALNARQASETRVRRFVADASHELRTPLAAIRGYAELSRRSQQPVPEDVAHALGRVESQAVRMTGLVEDLLLLASLDSGRPLVREPVDLTQLLIGAVGDAHAAGTSHVWRLDVPEVPVTVIGENARLTQVVTNLLANARTHTPPETQVTVGLRTEGVAPYESAVITVADNGPGIAPELLPEVFERFARGDSSRSRAAGSTGLGLAIVAAVVAAHHGTVAVTSIPGNTVFHVRLPVGPAPVTPLTDVSTP